MKKLGGLTEKLTNKMISSKSKAAAELVGERSWVTEPRHSACKRGLLPLAGP